MKNLIKFALMVGCVFAATACCCLPAPLFANDDGSIASIERAPTSTNAVAVAY